MSMSHAPAGTQLCTHTIHALISIVSRIYSHEAANKNRFSSHVMFPFLIDMYTHYYCKIFHWKHTRVWTVYYRILIENALMIAGKFHSYMYMYLPTMSMYPFC